MRSWMIVVVIPVGCNGSAENRKIMCRMESQLDVDVE